MSRLSKEIKAEPTQTRRVGRAVVPPVLTYKEEWRDRNQSITNRREYRIGVILGVKVWLDEDDIAISKAVRLAKANVIDTVFGEFRGPLLRAIMELECGDHEVAQTLIQGVFDTMFDGQ